MFVTYHCPLGWLFCSRDDYRCNYRNSCSVDVRSEIFEEDPCPGTGKYIEAQYYCLGWCTLFFSTDESSFVELHTSAQDHDFSKINVIKRTNIKIKKCQNSREIPWRKAWIFEMRKSNERHKLCRKSLPRKSEYPSSSIHNGKREGTGSMVQYTLVRVYVCHVNRPIATQVQRPAELQHCCIDTAIRRSLSQHAQVPRGALSLPVR